MPNNEFYKLAYNYHKRWAPYPATPLEWDIASQQAAVICSSLNNHPFLMRLMAAVYEEMARTMHQEEEGKA